MVLTFNARKRARAAQVSSEWPAGGADIYAALGVSLGELKRMQNEFEGQIVLPGMPDYAEDSQGNPLYPASPKIIAYCEVFNDVRLCLEWARAHGWWVTCRSGGHSTAGFSLNNGMVIDVSEMNYVVIDAEARRARIGAGARFGAINSMLNTCELHMPGGECDTVGVAGFMQGGGYGFTSREYGMNSDNVVAFTMMLADGRIVVARDAGPYRDLFWAVRGGTGGNFGVLLEIEYKLHELHEVWGVCLRWPIDQAPDVLVELQKNYMRTGATPKLGYQIVLATLDAAPVVIFMGMYHGSAEEGRDAIQSILKIGEPKVLVDRLDAYANLNASLIGDQLPGPPEGATTYELKRTAYVAETLKAADWRRLVECFKTAPNPFNIAAMEVYGGAINAFPAADSAFVHRDVDFNFFVDSFFQEQWEYNGRDSAQKWLDAMMGSISDHVNGHIYQNYPKRNSPNFRWEYWGKAFNALLSIKQKYDPDNFFHFEQSISPIPADAPAEVVRPDGAP